MTTTTATPSSAAQIQELVSKATDPQKKIDLLTFRLEELEDRSSVEARKIENKSGPSRTLQELLELA